MLSGLWLVAVVLDSTGLELTRKSQDIHKEYRAQRNVFNNTMRKQSAELGAGKMENSIGQMT